MKFTREGNEYFGRFEENEEIKDALLKFAREQDVKTAWFSIIGAVKGSTIAFYDQKEKKYLSMQLEEEAEILHCAGSISMSSGEPFVHVHITLSDREGKAYGGHLMSAKIFAAEFYMKKFGTPVGRKMDASTNLALLDP